MEELNVLIKEVEIIDPKSEHHQQTVDVLIENGIITQISTNINAQTETIDAKGMQLMPGFMDLQSNFKDPGEEHKETIESGLDAALTGGYTAINLIPDTAHPITSKSHIEYIKGKGDKSPIDLYISGPISEGLKGENLSEMYDLMLGGAIAFTDAKKEMTAGLLSRALLYSLNIDSLCMSFPFDRTLGDGYVNESKYSALTGLKSIPSIAESTQVARDIELAKYNNAPLHFSIISTKESVELIRNAKKEGLRITCATTPMHLSYNDEESLKFESNFKILPPLRSEADRSALWEGLKDGSIDAICTDHDPQDHESKTCEFDQAEFGVIGLETCYSMLSVNSEFTADICYKALVSGPREILKIKVPIISEGEKANMVLLNQHESWDYSKSHSKSKNSPLLGQTIKGKVVRTFKS